MSYPRVTVAVCFYGFKPQCDGCLESLLGLLWGDLEILLVDDGSPDDTRSRLDAFRDAHPECVIRVIGHDRNRGLSAARNTAAAAACGELIFFTSSDCKPDPDWVRRLAPCFDDPGVAAASGLTVDHSPRTLAEEAFTGSTRILPGGLQTRALVGNNMAFRRSVLLECPFDTAMTYYADEDEIAWRLSSTGRSIAFSPDAVVRHDHPMTLRQYLRQARHQGQGSARLWYKQGRFVGRDILPVTLALLTLPFGLVSPWLLLVPAFFALSQLAALVYNQYALKCKWLATSLKVLPIEVAYYAYKTTSVYLTLGRILLGYERAIRESKRKWWASQGASAPRSGQPGGGS